ncbi:MAG: multidrug effflux MFS transporter [Gammaproteobacteria bacterium]|nr:multidrug effflux MFS transporter [Gammaproteobacteria bacterium]
MNDSARPPPPPILFIALATASSVVGMTLLTPALTIIRDDLQATDNAVQHLLTVYMIALAAGQLIYGTLSDRVGRRPVLLIGASLLCVGGVLASLSQSIEVLTLYRVVQGLGAAACMAMGRAIINDCFSRSDAARYMSTVATILALAPALSVALGGVLAASIGWEGAMAFIGVCGGLVFFFTYTVVRETNLHPVPRINLRSVVAAYGYVLQRPIFVGFALVSGMQIGMFFAMNGFLPYQYQRMGYSAAEFGLWFSLTPISYLIGNTLNRHYFVSRGIERAAMLGCVLTLIATTLMLLTQELGWSHGLALALPGMLFGLGNGIVVANSTVGAMSAAGKHAGTGTGLAGAWQMAAGAVAGALIIGLGGASDFTIASGALVLMSMVSVSAMYFVYVRREPAEVETS